MRRRTNWMFIALLACVVLCMCFMYIRPKLAMDGAVAGLESHYGIPVQLYGGADRAEAGRVLYGMPLAQVMDDFCRKDHLVWWRQPDGQYNIATRRYYESHVIGRHPVQRVAHVPNTPVFVVRAVCGVPKYFDRTCSSVYDPRCQKVILNGMSPQRAAAVLQAIDRFCGAFT